MDTYIDENGDERFGLTWEEVNALVEMILADREV